MLYPAELRARSIKSCSSLVCQPRLPADSAPSCAPQHHATERVAVHYLILLGLCISNSAVAFRIACLPVHLHRERVPEVVHTWCRSTFAAVQARRKLLIILLLLKVPQHSRSGKASAGPSALRQSAAGRAPRRIRPFLGQNSHGLGAPADRFGGELLDQRVARRCRRSQAVALLRYLGTTRT